MKKAMVFVVLVLGLLLALQVAAQTPQTPQQQAPEAALVFKPGGKFWIVYAFQQPTDATGGGCVFNLTTERHPNQTQFGTGFGSSRWSKLSPTEYECEMEVTEGWATGIYELRRLSLSFPKGVEFVYELGKDFQAAIKVRIVNPATDEQRPKLKDVRLVPTK